MLDPTTSSTQKTETAQVIPLGKINKSDFIRSFPLSITASEVVAKAAEQGIKITPAFVYVVRGKMKAKAGTAKKRDRLPKSPAAVSQPPGVKKVAPKTAAPRAGGIFTQAELDDFKVRAIRSASSKELVAELSRRLEG